MVEKVLNFMTDSELTEAETLECARRFADERGLVIRSVHRDETLFVTFEAQRASRVQQDSESLVAREKVTLWSAGTGAFLFDFDGNYTWQDFAYDAASQRAVIERAAAIADLYLRGEGNVEPVKRIFGPQDHYLSIMLMGDEIVLKRKR